MKRLIFNLALVIATIFCACGSPMKAFNSNSNGWKPSNFNPTHGILLVEKDYMPKNQQNKIEDYMAKNYPYKYEFVALKDLEGDNKKYQDKNLYRFALVSSYSTHNIHQYDISQRPINVGTFDFNFIDRVNNKDYPKSGIASSWASMTFIKIIEACLKS